MSQGRQVSAYRRLSRYSRLIEDDDLIGRCHVF